MAEGLRIVEVNPFFYPFRGGIEHRIHNISKRLAAKHELFVLTSQLENTLPRERMDGYEVVRLPSKYFGSYNPPYVKTPGLSKALNELRPDVVDFHYRWAPTYNRLAREFDGRKVFTFHNTYGEGVGITRVSSLMNDLLWKRHLKKFEKVICISEFIKKDLASRGLDHERLVTIPNGVDMPDGHIDRTEENFILFVGRLVGTKGLPYLIKAMPRIDSRLMICGAGPDEASLKKLTSKLGLTNKIEFAGKVSEDRKSELLSTCKLFVMPSTFESYGIAVAEAMSYGKAIVSTNIGGLPEVVGNGGVLCRSKDESDLAEKINSLLSNDGARHAFGKRAEELARNYSWDRSAERTADLYKSIA
ncbi:MAG: glycosyltransferase family 4 protein [Methanomassiliicoccales archaeon]|jgi:glycosyltransferase involved in cell wall biosynthesis